MEYKANSSFEIKFVFDFGLCTLNKYIDAERKDKQFAANIKKKLTRKIYLHTLNQLRRMPEYNRECLFDVDIFWQTKDNRTDSDNIYFAIKFMLDGLVESKAIIKDGRKYIRDISHKIQTTGKEKIVVVLKKATERNFIFE